MQLAVEELMKLGPLPSSVNPDAIKIEKFQMLLTKIEQPITDDDARSLISLFGPDDCFGLAWTLLHIIETAPGWPLKDVLSVANNEWIDLLKQRAGN